MKRGQTEIIGLVIIVLIITIGLLFYVSSATNEDITNTGGELYDSYSKSELSTSFLQTLLHTDVAECQASYEDVVKDCGRGRNKLRCLDSCAQAKIVLEDVMNTTLNVWDYPYELAIHYSNTKQLNYTTEGCGEETVERGAPAIFITSYYPQPGTARLRLGFCE